MGGKAISSNPVRQRQVRFFLQQLFSLISNPAGGRISANGGRDASRRGRLIISRGCLCRLSSGPMPKSASGRWAVSGPVGSARQESSAAVSRLSTPNDAVTPRAMNIYRGPGGGLQQVHRDELASAGRARGGIIAQ